MKEVFCAAEVCSLCHTFINLRSTECLTLCSNSICRDSYMKCLFFNDSLCAIFQNSSQCTCLNTHIHGQIPHTEAERNINNRTVVFRASKASR